MLARMSKRALALLMVFCMVVSALSISALAIELPNGEDTPGSLDGRMFEYHVTYSALEELKDYYGYEGDVENVTIVFKQDFSLIEGESRRMINNVAAQCHSISFSMTRYGKAGPNEIKQFDIKFCDGTVRSVPESDLACTLITEQGAAVPIYEVSLKESLRPTDPTPEESESVYVYLKAVDGLGQDNGRGYITVGEIKMNLPDASTEYRTGGEARCSEYADEISAALANIARYNDNTIDLSDVEWYTLHCASGADGYVENREAWHLDGKVRVYNVNYHHNNGTETVTTDPNGYMAGESFTTMTIEGLNYEGHTLLGWSTDPEATTPATSFSIPADGGDVDLYAVWQLDEPAAETYDAWFFIRTDGVIPIEDGTTQYDSSYYKPAHNDDGTGALTGKVDGTAAWTTYYGPIENGAINGVKLSEAFAEVAKHIDTAPADDAIKTALGKDFDPATQGVVWYVVKEMDNGTDYTGQCPGWHVDGIVYTKGEGTTEVRILNYYRNVEDNESPIAFSVHGLGTTATVSAGITPTREGYEFTGWNTAADGSGTPYKAGDPIPMTKDVNLYAQWEEKGTEPEPSTYTVTYKYEGSVPSGYTAPVDSNKYAKDDEVTVSTEPSTIPDNYTFSGWKAEGITITDGKFTMPEGSVTLTGTWTYAEPTPEPTPDPTPSYNYYHVTVNYLDRADNSKIAESYVSPSRIQGSRYDVSEYDAIAIEGYTYDATEGDDVTGVLNSNKTVNVYYMAGGTEIDDGDTPTGGLPEIPGEGGEVDIDDGQTPTTDLPDTGSTGESSNAGSTGGDIGGDVEIHDEGTPTGSLPQTGTLAQTSAARAALGILALTASLMAAGLALVLFRKSRKAWAADTAE
ncbi:InlB B-repeat-containing protein [uncultured Pseudoflavonifractor sp.]|uniref:InlB B-repeat-containing protein n=1 Tax=uncultured Pseudoflavonifractor sp. TaxID=1221379 RepID=UPI0025DAE4D1|nr:InlB B-repeat-containing protein [uncultured Pseudoflavonifractor sp.]